MFYTNDNFSYCELKSAKILRFAEKEVIGIFYSVTVNAL